MEGGFKCGQGGDIPNFEGIPECGGTGNKWVLEWGSSAHVPAFTYTHIVSSS